MFIKKSLKLLTWKKYYHNFSAFEKFSLLLDSLFFASRVCFQFPLQEKMFEPNMLLAAMNNADSNNHNYNHEDNNNEGFLRDDEFDSANTKSGSENQEGGSGNDQDPLHPNKKKRYHRHTQLQIQEMEAYAFKLLTCFNFFFFWQFLFWLFNRFFKECPHPDDKQRKQLSRELGLEPLQVKFWFQNKRTQMKVYFITINTYI